MKCHLIANCEEPDQLIRLLLQEQFDLGLHCWSSVIWVCNFSSHFCKVASCQSFRSFLYALSLHYIVLKMLSAFYIRCIFTSAAYIKVHFKLDFFMEANNMNLEHFDLGPYCLQLRL